MKLSVQVIRFGCVGVAAMLVHLGVVSVLVPGGMSPLVANVAAFTVAFQVSYGGHRRWTFEADGGWGAYLRMLAVSLASFALNEAMYAGLLRFTTLDYRAALFLVLVVVAFLTFAASRLWVFTRGEQPS
ncbi:GtrA family protein [Luteolibacter ambystomatis]|uniref:GtrA family protein n=1 Tax=Luteolibacter ambystomatis TaxID=2824561 RepID=A0A975G9C0_9BACT|nr:GtrA family protein [Luteolibacter ambystomatis]QUE51186.1 GtrA family protein [Luteolibacter ambystomatis]